MRRTLIAVALLLVSLLALLNAMTWSEAETALPPASTAPTNTAEPRPYAPVQKAPSSPDTGVSTPAHRRNGESGEIGASGKSGDVRSIRPQRAPISTR